MIADLFAGAGGWDVAARMLGLSTHSYEVDKDAVKTLAAAGFPHTQCDLTTHPVQPCRAIVASPPCQPFSAAGKKQGRTDPRAALPYVVPTWAAQEGVEWVAVEQVPGASSVFSRVAVMLITLGFKVAKHTLHSECYGVPQTRDRIILMAHRATKPPLPPPTHSRYYPTNPGRLDEGVLPWVTMAQALAWGMDRPSYTFPAGGEGRSTGKEWGSAATRDLMRRAVLSTYSTHGDYSRRGVRDQDAPAATVTTHVDRNKVITMGDRYSGHGAIRPADHPAMTIMAGHDNHNLRWAAQRPSTTVVAEFQPRIQAAPGWRTRGPRQDAEGSIAVTVTEAGTLQSFPPDHPWQGSQTAQYRQVGNAIPPLMARAIIETLESL